MQSKSYGPATPVARQVCVLGLGAAQLGDEAVSEAQASHLLNTALDLGMTLIDTARGYGQSEARIGRHLAHRRSEYTLSTKVGYGIEGQADWTPAIIEAGVDAALNLMRTDHIDIVHLHSCPIGTLQHSGVVEALVRLREKGKMGVAAYSGDNAELAWAVASGAFGGIECSINLFDQANLPAIAAAHAKGLGAIAKRTLGNAPWRFAQQPVGHYCETYWQRMQALAYDTTGLPWDELALRFCLGLPEITCAIVGTSSEANLRHNVKLAERGPLPPATMVAVRDRFAALGANWPAEI
jgi:aryl-alcohol dehydrogenase-like predicted oxidoreductase